MKRLTLRTSALLALGAFAALAHAQRQGQNLSDQAYEVLAKDVVWVYPGYEQTLNLDQVRAAAKKIAPTQLKVLWIPELRGKWKRGDQELRGSYAEWLLKTRLTLKDAVVVVCTKQGVSAYSDTVDKKDLTSFINESLKYKQGTNYTGMVTFMAEQISNKGNRNEAVKNTSTGALIAIPIMGGLGVVGYLAFKKKKKMDDARNRVLNAKNAALSGISYIDGYTGLIDGPEAQQITAHREMAYSAFERGRQAMDAAKKPEDFDAADQAFRLALTDIDKAKQIIDQKTGGTGAAFGLPPVVDQQRAPLFDPVPGTCFFTSKPCDELRPVEVTVQGQRRTVMVSPEIYQSMQNGAPPQIAGTVQDNQFTPWYQVQGYDPYRHYGTRDFLWDMMTFNAISSMMNPWGWWGGGWGHHHHHHYGDGYGYGHNDYGSGGGGWFGGGSDGGSNLGVSDFDQAGNFSGDSGGDFGDSGGGGGFDFGGFFGGGSDGGGDFGGGDFGGGDGGGDF